MRKLSVKNKWVIAGAAVVVLAVLGGLFWWNSQRKPESAATQVIYIYNNPCATCKTEEKFIDLFNQSVAGIKEKLVIEMSFINLFKEDQQDIESLMKKYKLETMPETMLVIGDQVSIGTQTESTIRPLFWQAVGFGTQKEVLEYYYREECPDCAQIKPFLEDLFKKYPDLPVVKIDTAPENSKAAFKQYFADQKIDKEKWQIPFVVYQGENLSGCEEIQTRLEELVRAQQTQE